MIEKIDNSVQLISLGICTVLALYRALSSHDRSWATLAMFYASMTLGNLYWFLYMVFYGETPLYSLIPDSCWIAAFLFLLLLIHKDGDKIRWKEHKILYLIPVFTVGMCVYYMRFGKYLTNVFYAVFMTLIMCCSLDGLLSFGKECGRYHLHLITFVFCLVEYLLWTASCFDWTGPAYLDPYYIFDMLLTVVYILFYPATGKAARDELY